MRANRSRPAEAAPETPAKKSVTTVRRTADITWPDTGLDLSRLDDLQGRIWEAGYFRGYIHGHAGGVDVGRGQAEDETRRAWLPVVRHVRALGSSKTHAELVAIREANFRTAQPVPTVAECEQSWKPFLQRGAA